MHEMFAQFFSKLLNFYFILFFSIVSISVTNAQNGKGYNLDNADDKMIPKSLSYFGEVEGRGLYENLATKKPSAYSLRKYCPTPGNQGQFGTCVGWSVGYGAFSLLYNLSNNQITAQTKKVIFSPLYAFHIYKQQNYFEKKCDGSNILPYLNIINNYGICQFNELDNNCDQYQVTERAMSEASVYKDVLDIATIFDKKSQLSIAQKVVEIKNAIFNNRPVLIGISCDPGFDRRYLSPPFTYSCPSKHPGEIDGHAVLCVGYDDQTRRLQILNSWGADFCDNGFFYINYDNVSKTIDDAYSIQLKRPINISKDIPNTISCSIAISVLGDKILSKKEPYTDGGKYELSKMFGRKFTLSISSENSISSYRLTAFNVDAANKKLLIFPSENTSFNNSFLANESAPISSTISNTIDPGKKLVIPNPRAKQNGFIKAEKGTEPLIVLIGNYQYFNPNIIMADVNYNDDYINSLRSSFKKHYPKIKLLDPVFSPNYLGFKSLSLYDYQVVPIIVYFNE